TLLMRMVWSSWKCNSKDLGTDVQLYEVMKSDANIACPIVSGSLPDEVPFTKAALLVILADVCPAQNSKTLQEWRREISRCAGSGSRPTVEEGPGGPIVEGGIICTFGIFD